VRTFLPAAIDKAFIFHSNIYEKGTLCQEDLAQNMGCVDEHCAGDLSRRLLFDKSAHLFVDLPVTKAILNKIQPDLSLTPLISFVDFSNSQSVMPAYIHCRNI
jgi:hypothetical protein